MKKIQIDVISPSENHLLLIGVPFVEATFHEGDGLELKIGERKISLWYTVRNVWKDGSIRWIFMHTRLPAGESTLSLLILKGQAREQESVEILDHSVSLDGCRFAVTAEGFTFETPNGSVSYSADAIESDLASAPFNPGEAEISLVEASPIAPLLRIREKAYNLNSNSRVVILSV